MAEFSLHPIPELLVLSVSLTSVLPQLETEGQQWMDLGWLYRPGKNTSWPASWMKHERRTCTFEADREICSYPTLLGERAPGDVSTDTCDL